MQRTRSRPLRIRSLVPRAFPSALFLGAAILIAACGTDDGEPDLSPVALAETELAGSYTLADYLYEYGDGGRLDPSVLQITGTLVIGIDSAYEEDIKVGAENTLTAGRITGILAAPGRKAGELTLTLDGSDASHAGKTGFSFRGDTLTLITEVSKELDVSKKGFRETAHYVRDPAATD
jgi:hypothetical protein